MDKIRVTIWHEYRHEKTHEDVKAIYPEGIHSCVRDFLSDCDDMEVTIVALDDPEQGLPDELLNNTDVLLWWGHCAHKEVDDALVERIKARVYAGMGFFGMHSAHESKPFKAILGTTGMLSWGREQRCIVWNVMPTHPIAEGVDPHFELEEELYAEPFYIPTPDELIFTTWYEDGFVFRGGATFRRGLGKIFYFHPGHESCRSFYDENVRKIYKNAIRWLAPAKLAYELPDKCPHIKEPVFVKE